MNAESNSVELLGMVPAGLVLIVYFLPALIAYLRDARAYAKIAFLNIVFGWTVIGWILALIWSLLDTRILEWRKQRRFATSSSPST
jgi:hypothetical protein